MATNKPCIEIPNRFKSLNNSDDPAIAHIVAGADDVYDDSQGRKQNMVNADVARHEAEINDPTNGLQKRVDDIEAMSQIGDTPVETDAGNIISNTSLSGKVPSASAVNGVYNALDAQTGYYTCDTAGGEAAKTVAAPGFVLSNGGSVKIKMTNANSASNATLNINSTGAKALYYDGERAGSSNTWEDGETIEVYYDGTSYYANNVAGGSSDGVFDLTAKTGDTYATLSDALTAANTAIPANKKKGGMSMKYVHTSDNNYIQARCMAQNFTTDVTQWQGVTNEVKADSKDLVESGAVFSSIYITIDLAEDATWVDGYAIDARNGYSYSLEGYSYCDFIDISNYKKILIKSIGSSRYGGAFYREKNSGTYIEGFGNNPQIPPYSDIEVNVPTNAKYCKLTKILSESSDNKQGIYVDVSKIDKAVEESEERINVRLNELDTKDTELSSEIDSINTQLEGLYIEKPLGIYGIGIGTLKSGEAINILIQDTTAQYVSLMYNGSSITIFYKGIPSSYVNTSESEQTLFLQTNPNDVIKAIVQKPQQENADNAFCIPRSVTLPASGNIYTSHTYYLKRGVKYSLEINDWVIPSTNQVTFEMSLDGVHLMTRPVKKICLKPDLSGGSDFARLIIGGRIAEGHNATIILSNDDIEEQEAEITGLGSTLVSHTFGVNEGKIYYVDVKKWVSNDNETGQHFGITFHKKDGTTETPILKTTQVADYSSLYEIDTSNVLAITVSGRIKEGLTSVVKVYEKEKVPNIKIDVQGNGSTYVQGKAEIWPGVYKVTVSDWHAATSGGTSFYIYLKDVDNNTLVIKNVMKVARNFDGDYMITVPDNYCEIHFDGRIVNDMTAHIEIEKLESARDFPANRCNLDFPVFGCGRYSVQAPNCTYAHGGIVIFNEKYIFVQFFRSDAFYGENYYGTAGLAVIDKYSRSIRHIDVFSPRAIYLNGQLLEHTHIAMMVALNDYTVRICGTVKVSDVCTIINRTYNAEDNILGDNIVCNLKYNDNTVTYDINNFMEMGNTLYSLGLTPDANKHAVDLPRLCKYNGEYYGAFNVDECAVGMNANTFIIMKSADGITWEPVNCVTGDYQVTETGITFCDNKFFVIGRSESGHFCWYCVTDVEGNVLKPMTPIPNSIHSMPTITTSRNKVYVMYNVTPDSGSHYTRTKCCFTEIGTTGNYELTVLNTYVDNNGIHYFNMTTKPNGVILMSYITDPESYISNDNPTSDICLAEINV